MKSFSHTYNTNPNPNRNKKDKNTKNSIHLLRSHVSPIKPKTANQSTLANPTPVFFLLYFFFCCTSQICEKGFPMGFPTFLPIHTHPIPPFLNLPHPSSPQHTPSDLALHIINKIRILYPGNLFISKFPFFFLSCHLNRRVERERREKWF